MEALAHDDGGFFNLVGEIDVLQELVCDHFQRVFGPVLEPIDSTATDHGRIEPQTVSERRTDRAEAQTDVQVPLTLADEIVEHNQRRYVQVSVSSLSS